LAICVESLLLVVSTRMVVSVFEVFDVSSDTAFESENLKLKAAGVAASIRPRPASGSYMPVFRAGEVAARALAAGCGANFVESTHQEGHIAAGLWSLGLKWSEFWVYHLSGGTTQFLTAERKGSDGNGKT